MDAYSGLTGEQVAERQAQGLTNAVEETTSRSLAEIIRANFVTRFNAVLGVLFVVVIVTGSIADALFGGVVVVNSLVGAVQEYLAKRKLDKLTLMTAPSTKVVRDGVLRVIPTHEIVMDDLIEVHSGDRIPADGVLVSSDGLEVNEANLTGESDPVHKDSGDGVMSGTFVVAGAGRFTATAVGAEAHVHRIAAEAKVFTRTSSEIQRSTDTLLRYVTWVIVFVAPLQIWSQFNVMDVSNWRGAIVRSAAGIVGLIPEGLVLLTTLAFLSAAVRLTRQQVLVQELPAVEVLARVSVICLDKTGTITTGQIVFEAVEQLSDVDIDTVYSALHALARGETTGTLETIASSVPMPEAWEVHGSIPFSSARKWSAVRAGDRGTWVLGAPEVLLSGNDEALNRVNALADTGRRVVLLSTTDQPLPDAGLPANLRPAALVTLREDIRSDAAETLAYFAEQGVAVKIISGDNPRTVSAIARQVGLDVPDGVDARALGSTAEDVSDAVRTEAVFGRVSPEQKKAFVMALQNAGEVVAMTGDGVNDVLALKQSDLGIAMENGAPATKSVAQLVLLDGKFSHMPSVLREGRRVIGNVERVANLFVAKNAMSLMAILAAALLSLPFPLLPRHMTLLSTVTIGIPSFFLALAPNPNRYRPGFLRRVLMFSIPAGAIAGVAVVLSDFLARGQYGRVDGVKCAVVNVGANIGNTDCWRVGSAATASVLLVFLWILLVLARPYSFWKILPVAAMWVVAATVFVVPASQEFFNFNLPFELLVQSVVIGGAGSLVVEFLYRYGRNNS